MIAFICDDCARKQHESCRNGTWCDCQHVRKKGST